MYLTISMMQWEGCLMIKTKRDLKRYLDKDKEALDRMTRRPRLLSDEVWKFEIALRHREYYRNSKSKTSPIKCVKYVFWSILHHHYSIKYGFQVPCNVCGEGLRINHLGCLIINGNTKIGKNFNVHQGVNIGVNVELDKAPTIGDNVFVGPGTQIFGNIEIADNIAIAAGSVVNKSFKTPNVTIGGVPAKIINSEKGNPFIK